MSQMWYEHLFSKFESLLKGRGKDILDCEVVKGKKNNTWNGFPCVQIEYQGEMYSAVLIKHEEGNKISKSKEVTTREKRKWIEYIDQVRLEANNEYDVCNSPTIKVIQGKKI